MYAPIYCQIQKVIRNNTCNFSSANLHVQRLAVKLFHWSPPKLKHFTDIENALSNGMNYIPRKSTMLIKGQYICHKMNTATVAKCLSGLPRPDILASVEQGQHIFMGYATFATTPSA
ncbi:hypothetical protein NP493_384g01032 [Ridgeia piscesae]|uniref:Uncharacterized protein n=1 Tax=Ridgeia piscesae TaxID=27915 RepID=A0AAD9NV04_RIDPI|nr:hypothetical protein NP493_384g01032 [Ridgeia piscesae]